MKKRGALKLIKKLKESDIVLDNEPKSNYDKLKKKSEVDFLKKEASKIEDKPPKTELTLPVENKPKEPVISTEGATIVFSGPVTFQGGKLPSLEEERKVIMKDENILAIPQKWKTEDYTGFDTRYPLIESYAYARIKWDPNISKLTYIVEEPDLTEQDLAQLNLIQGIMQEELDADFKKFQETSELISYLENKALEIVDELNLRLAPDSFEKIMYYLRRNYIGLGAIEPLFYDPAIEDISCDGTGIPIFVYHAKYGSLSSNIVFQTDDDANSVIIKMAQRCNRHISVAEPLLDGRLPNNSRVQATFGREVTQHGPTFTLRRFKTEPMTPIQLIKYKSCPPRVFAYMWLALEHSYTASTLISGGTATGKTSMLNALAIFLPPEAKIVTIEDTQELNLPQEHWLPAVTRAGFGASTSEGKRQGEVDMFDLLRAALRQRPDYLVVGEIRGAEANGMFTGMATGHPGIGTIHADSMESLINRLITRPINLSPALLQSLNICFLLTHAKIEGKAIRRVKSVVEITGMDLQKGEPIYQTVFQWNPGPDDFTFEAKESSIVKRIAIARGMTQEDVWEEINRRSLVLSWMAENNIVHFKDVGAIIKEYVRDPDQIMKKIQS
ncbi:MAG: type II/IV secretion system ATPase subunit [Candidatus Methanofastidiosa archaeon]|nr:type II/IV secretion system ATPase subunit [Candidatus Methanofastidiosa archaeon]